MSNHERRRAVMRSRWSHDGLNAYKRRAAELIRPGMRVLHLGCGRDKSETTYPYRETCEVVGVDPDASMQGAFHSTFLLGTAEDIPVEDASFDVVLSEYMLEHIQDPRRAFAEIHRVLKPGGVFLALTPNAYSYKTLLSKAMPHRLHEVLNERLRGFDENDIYPTTYRCNTEAAIRRVTGGTAWALTRLTYVNNGPTWFVRIPVAFGLGDLAHRSLDRFGALERLKCNIVLEMHRAGGSADHEGAGV